MSATATLVAPVDLASARVVARESGIVAAVTVLHAELGGAVLPTGPGGHAFLPEHLVRGCAVYSTPAGPELRAGAAERWLAEVPVGPDTMVALHLPGGGPAAGTGAPDSWAVGLGWVRLGLADRFLAGAAEHLRGRKVQDTVTLNLPPVRVLLAEAAVAIAEAHALLAAGPDRAALHRVHRALDEGGRVCLHLYGATGFLAGGPGSEVRASELLGDTYARVYTVEEEW